VPFPFLVCTELLSIFRAATMAANETPHPSISPCTLGFRNGSLELDFRFRNGSLELDFSEAPLSTMVSTVALMSMVVVVDLAQAGLNGKSTAS
jgi:hypothetical protein